MVGRPDEMKGQAVVAFVTLKEKEHATPELREKLRQHVATAIGAIAKPDDIRFADALPKTRSGKIMRRLLKEIAGGGQVTGDTTTLEDFNVLAKLKGVEESRGKSGTASKKCAASLYANPCSVRRRKRPGARWIRSAPCRGSGGLPGAVFPPFPGNRTAR